MHNDGKFEVELEYKTKEFDYPFGDYSSFNHYDMEWAAGIVTFFLMNPDVDTIVTHGTNENQTNKFRRIKKDKCCK